MGVLHESLVRSVIRLGRQKERDGEWANTAR